MKKDRKDLDVQKRINNAEYAETEVCHGKNNGGVEIDSDIQLLSEEQRQEILTLSKGEDLCFDYSLTLVDIFRNSVKRSPDAVAVVYKERQMTYREVDEVTDRIALKLCSMGVEKERVVGVLIERSEFLLLYPLAVMKAGGAYMPLDMSFPEERLLYMCEDAGVQLILSDGGVAGDIMPNFKGVVFDSSAIASLEPISKAELDSLPKVEASNMFTILYTSGSTGLPKGCVLEHRNIVNFCHWYVGEIRLTSEDRTAAYANFGFDAHMIDMYPTLLAGASVYIVPSDMRMDIDSLNSYFEENNISVTFITTQIGYMLATLKENKSLRLLSVGGEALKPLKLPTYELYNIYGPTECTICSTFYKMKEDDEHPLIGRPVSGYQVYVVDKHMNLVPKGVSGELLVVGRGVSRGYLNRPELTAEKFISFNGEIAYRTGDLVRWTDCGEIDFIGRIDNQVKLRGFRIELGEIENAVNSYDNILSSVVEVKEIAGVQHLCAYYTSNIEIDKDSLKEHLSQSLTSYMVPTAYIQLAELPFTANGKVDRKRLPSPEIELEEIVAPQGETETKLFDIIAELFGNRNFGVINNLISIGLTSLLSIRLTSLISKNFGVKVPMKKILQSPTIKALASYIESSSEMVEDDKTYEKRQYYPLTENQRGLYVDWEMNRETTQYNIPTALIFRDIDSEKLKGALTKFINNHPGLKSHLAIVDGEVVVERCDDREIAIKCTKIDGSLTKEELQSKAHPFDLFADELSRFEIIESADATYLFIDIHHIVFDGGSLAILFAELGAAYNGEQVMPEVFTPFDKALQEQEILTPEYLSSLDDYFEALISQVETTSYPHSSTNLEVGCKSYQTSISGDGISTLLKSIGATPSNYFLAVTMEALHRLTREQRVLITTISNGRGDLHLLDSIGMFVKTLPAVSEQKSISVEESVKAMQNQMIESISRDVYPFTRLVERHSVGAEIMYVFQENFAGLLPFDECEYRPLELSAARLPITIQVSQTANSDYDLTIDYDSALYSYESMTILAQSIKNLSENISSKDEVITNVSILSSEQHQAVLELSKGEELEYNRAETIIDALIRNAESHPRRVAVVDRCSEINYEELSNYSNNVAFKLIEMGVEKDDFVGVMLPRRKEFSAAQLGIMRSGAAYVPLDVDYPNDRIEYMLKDSKAKVLITTRELYAQKQNEGDFAINGVLYIEDIECSTTGTSINRSTPDGLAYMIYTSGSTGLPKGVMLPHCALSAYVAWQVSEVGISENSRYAVHPSFSFDISIDNLIVPLTVGATIYILDEHIRKDLSAMYSYIEENQITGLTMGTALGMTMLNQYPNLPVKHMTVGGERLLPFAKTDIRVINGYGPTEFTVYSSFHVVNQDTDSEIPIGRPVPNSSSFIVDSNGNLLPIGVAGELCLMGVQISKGYWQREELTAERFVDCKFVKGQKMYRTGDLVRWSESGKLEYIGRMDHQVKLRGFRIELGEIEAQVKSYSGVLSSVVEVREISGMQHLCAYYTSEMEIDKNSLKQHLAKSLTDYMVPTAYIQLEELPFTPNGKVDRKKLPDPVLERMSDFIAPRNEYESDICRLFAEQLSLEEVSVNDDYFSIGGSSLSAIRLVIEIDKLGYEIKYSDLFNMKTPEKIAQFVSNKSCEESSTDDSYFDLSNYDYSAIDKLLSENGNVDRIYDSSPYVFKNVLLTGATGYLGAYLLNRVIQSGASKIYCLVRPSQRISALERLKSVYAYYFDDLEAFERGVIEVIDGDITDEDIVSKLSAYDFDTLINPAAMVKHFVSDDSMYRVNVGGVEHLIELCEKKRARLIHISTYSVAAMVKPQDASRLTESKLYFGQMNNNEYVRTKFLAERALLQAIADGRVDGKVMRVGNLMGRENDGEFQMNFRSNAFINTIMSYKVLQAFPLKSMNSSLEVSPINRVAEAIVKLISTPKEMVVFHPFNPYSVDMGVVVKAMNSYGFAVDLLNNDQFKERVKRLGQDAEKSIYLQGLIHSDASNMADCIEAPVDNYFTTTLLYHLDFYWPVVNNDYFANLLVSLDSLGLFDE